MKKLLLLSAFLIGFFIPKAQQCLNINIASMMGSMSMPANSSASYKQCETNKNDKNQTEITSYGKDIRDIDTLVAQTSRKFNNDYMASTIGMAGQASQQDVNAAMDMAEKMKSMTPDQQKAYAMQIAQQQQQNRTAQQVQDNPALTKLVYETYDLAINKMKAVDDEFAARLRALDDAMSKEIALIKRGDKTKCPGDITGLANCDCVNKIEAQYWQQVIAVNDKYDQQKSALFQDYSGRLKSILSTVESNISTCKNGDALKSPQLKKMLFSAQSSAFGNAFIVTSYCMKDTRTKGADAFRNKVNSDANVYDISCSKK
jgi:hypothetical protein